MYFPLLAGLVGLLIITGCLENVQYDKRTCEEYGTLKVYHGSYLPVNSWVSINIDDGTYIWRRYFLLGYLDDTERLLVEYCPVSDSIKINFRLNLKDTTFYLKSDSHWQLGLGSNDEREFSIGKSDDIDYWIRE